MMVIRGTSGGVVRIHPADRCTWTQNNMTPGGPAESYVISNVEFYGLGTSPVPVTNAQLGYIGKSGRFVGISE